MRRKKIHTKKNIGLDSVHAVRAALLRPGARSRVIAELKTCGTLEKLLEHLVPLSGPTYLRALWGPTIQFDYKGGRIWSPYPKDLCAELFWNTACAFTNSALINSFLKVRENVSKELLLGQAKDAEIELDEFERNYGVSIWGIEARYAITLALHGQTKAQQDLNRILEDQETDGTIKLLAKQFSLRANPDSSPDYLLNIIKTKTPWLNCYLGLKLNPFIPPEKEHLISCFRRETRFSVFDRYLLLSTVLSWLIADRNLTAALDSAVRQCVALLNPTISDPSLVSMARFLGDGPEVQVPDASDYLALLDEYTLGKYESVCAINIGSDGPSNIYAEIIELKAKAGLHALSIQKIQSNAPIFQIENEVKKIIEKNSGYDSAITAVQRWILANSYYPRAAYFCGLFARETSVFYDRELARINSNRALIFSHPLNPAQVKRSEASQRSEYISSFPTKFNASVTAVLINEVYGTSSDGLSRLESLPIPQNRKELYKGHWNFYRGNYAEAISFYRGQVESKNRLVYQDSVKGLIRTYIQMGQLGEGVTLAAETYISHPELHAILEIEDLVFEYEKSKPVDVASSIDLPILSHAYSRAVSSEKDTRLAVRIENFLTAHKLMKPSEIADALSAFEPKKIIYFLKEVCGPEALQDFVFLAFDSPEDIQQERIAICRRLIDLDPDSRKEYVEEIADRTRELSLRSGLKVVNQSRIHVDIDGIRRSITATIEHVFSRYQVLRVSTHPGAQYELREMHINDPAKESVVVFSYRSERDLLLRAMIIDIRDRFVSSSEYGLDGYLSMKIRHGTLQGQLWRPLETENLVTPREKSGQHRANSYWSKGLEADASMKLELALGRFSADIYELISLLRDNWLHIKVEDSISYGLFDFTLADPDFDSIEEKLQSGHSAHDFISIVIDHLWTRTERSLVIVQDKITTDLLARFDKSFERLLASLSFVSGIESVSALVKVITEMRTNTAHELRRIAGWFQKPMESQIENFPASLVVDVAVSAINNTSSSLRFSPKIDIPNEVTFHGNSFRPLFDVFVTLFENAIKHSGVSTRYPNVRVLLSVESGVVTIEMKNEIESGFLTLQARERLEKIRREIQSESYSSVYIDRVKSEGGTGLHKIMKVINVDLKSFGKLEFGLNEDSSEFVFAAEIDSGGLLS